MRWDEHIPAMGDLGWREEPEPALGRAELPDRFPLILAEREHDLPRIVQMHNVLRSKLTDSSPKLLDILDVQVASNNGNLSRLVGRVRDMSN